MANKSRIVQDCGMINRVFAVYFLNETGISRINYQHAKPKMASIASLNENMYFVPTDSPHGLKEFFHGKVVIENIEMEKYKSVGIYDFFNQEMKDKIKMVADDFVHCVERNKYCDFVFSCLPDVIPHIFDCILDPDTNFRSRMVIGHDLMSNSYSAIWEFYCLLMIRFREAETHPIYGKSFRDVNELSKEELEKYGIKLEVEAINERH